MSELLIEALRNEKAEIQERLSVVLIELGKAGRERNAAVEELDKIRRVPEGQSWTKLRDAYAALHRRAAELQFAEMELRRKFSDDPTGQIAKLQQELASVADSLDDERASRNGAIQMGIRAHEREVSTERSNLRLKITRLQAESKKRGRAVGGLKGIITQLRDRMEAWKESEPVWALGHVAGIAPDDPIYKLKLPWF